MIGKAAAKKRRKKMSHRAKLRAKMTLEQLVHSNTPLLSLSKESRRKMAENGKRKMASDHRRREAKRLKNMTKIEDLEDRGGTVLPPKIKL